ncbi:MAG: transporter [Sphingomonadales bacterium]|nr:transporter [Sphingomonadales bacterium]
MQRAIAGLILSAFAALSATAAQAEERDFCADRPGLGTPACTLAPGSAMVELGIGAWDHTTDAASVEDDVTLGDVLLRVGVTETTEVQIGVTGHVVQRSRDRASGSVDRVAGMGDGTLAIRQSLSGANGPVAIEVFAAAPLGKPPIGAGQWSGGILLPAGFTLPSGFELDFTPELDVTANGSGPGHHLAWGGVAGLSHGLGRQVTLTGEVAAFRDEDPGGHSTDARVAGSFAWQVSGHFQLDFEADAGLTAGAPDRSLALGLAWQFR